MAGDTPLSRRIIVTNHGPAIPANASDTNSTAGVITVKSQTSPYNRTDGPYNSGVCRVVATQALSRARAETNLEDQTHHSTVSSLAVVYLIDLIAKCRDSALYGDSRLCKHDHWESPIHAARRQGPGVAELASSWNQGDCPGRHRFFPLRQ